MYLLLALIGLVIVLCVWTRSEKLTSNVFVGGQSSWELEPQWELCAPCFAQCARSQWKGTLQPNLGETNKDMCARLCSNYCRGFAYKWPNSIHIGFEKHGM